MNYQLDGEQVGKVIANIVTAWWIDDEPSA